MSVRITLTLALAAAALGACETVAPAGGGLAPVSAAVFNAQDFAWSERIGTASISGVVAYSQGGRTYQCAGSVGLTPDTPYTRQRFSRLYGSVERAALPAETVRQRNVSDPSADYRAYTRSTTCENNRFAFNGLPDGGWFVIAQVSAPGSERMVLMQRVTTRGGRPVSISL